MLPDLNKRAAEQLVFDQVKMSEAGFDLLTVLFVEGAGLTFVSSEGRAREDLFAANADYDFADFLGGR